MVDEFLPACSAAPDGPAPSTNPIAWTLRKEAAALEADLHHGRWPIATSTWLGTNSNADPDLVARAEAVEWLWENRRPADGKVTRHLTFASAAPVLLIWSESGGLTAAVAGPAYLSTLLREALPDPDLGISLSDPEDRSIGTAPVPAHSLAVLTASAANLPWSLSVFPTQSNLVRRLV